MTPAQCRAARGLLKWTQDRLAARAGVNSVTIRCFENEQRAPHKGTLALMREAFEIAGIEFIAADDQAGIGLRLKSLAKNAGKPTIARSGGPLDPAMSVYQHTHA